MNGPIHRLLLWHLDQFATVRKRGRCAAVQFPAFENDRSRVPESIQNAYCNFINGGGRDADGGWWLLTAQASTETVAAGHYTLTTPAVYCNSPSSSSLPPATPSPPSPPEQTALAAYPLWRERLAGPAFLARATTLR